VPACPRSALRYFDGYRPRRSAERLRFAITGHVKSDYNADHPGRINKSRRDSLFGEGPPYLLYHCARRPLSVTESFAFSPRPKAVNINTGKFSMHEWLVPRSCCQSFLRCWLLLLLCSSSASPARGTLVIRSGERLACPDETTLIIGSWRARTSRRKALQLSPGNIARNEGGAVRGGLPR
jgi:hypothetical protein